MTTTDEIMFLAEEYAGGALICHPADSNILGARQALRTAIRELVAQAAWAHHTPALLSDADAAADLAGVARPGAEPVAYTSEQHFALREAHAIGASDAYFKAWPAHDDYAGRMLFERGFVRGFDAGEKLYTAPPQASQPGARPGEAPYAYAVYFPDEAREELVHRLDDLMDDLTNCTHGITPLYTTPPQASQPLSEQAVNQLPAAEEGWWPSTAPRIMRLVRDVEQAHGIGAQKGNT